MIRVDRKRVETPAVFIGANSPAAAELAAVSRYILEQPKKPRSRSRSRSKRPPAGQHPKRFKFEVYSDPQVKAALAALFRNKCAYCETVYAATQPVDVEHFRPKAGIEGEAEHPGYYWLAANWDNLLPSCIDCNRVRKQLLEQGEGRPAIEIKLGKGNRFPLAPRSLRSQRPGDGVKEEPLLLDPCQDEPESELHFTDDGIVKSARSDRSKAHLKATTSIEVYGLNRAGLVFSRLEVLRLLQGRMYSIECLVAILDGDISDSVRELLEDLLAHEFAALHAFREPHRPYTLMCRQVIKRFMDSLIGSESAAAR